MNSPSDANGVRNAPRAGHPVAAPGARTMNAFAVSEGSVAPFEFRSLTCEDAEELGLSVEARNGGSSGASGNGHGTHAERFGGAGHDRGLTDAMLRSAVDAARQEGLQQGEAAGRRAARAELEAEMNLAIARERKRVADSLEQFKGVRDRYFVEVEQEVVRLALAIAARVLHREAQVDPLLLTGVVRVALEKMADRSGVMLRVAGADVEAWEGVFRSVEPSDRPRVVEDPGLERGDCVLETKMGTVELGVRVQLQEIEKGFFDLLNHRPVE